jgi:hypothetical protein
MENDVDQPRVQAAPTRFPADDMTAEVRAVTFSPRQALSKSALLSKRHDNYHPLVERMTQTVPQRARNS